MKTSFIHIALICAIVGLAPLAASQTRTIRVVTYNIEDDIDGATVPLPGLINSSSGGSVTNGGVLEGIGEEMYGGDAAQPLDILALQETTSNPITVAPIVSGLNSFYNTPGMYAMSTYQATENGGDVADGNGPNALVYNTTTMQLLASVPVDPPGGTGNLGSSSGEYREVMRYELAPAGVAATAANEFYIYVSHYKSGTGTTNEKDRNGEAQIIRNDEANNLPATAQVLYVGDYNADNPEPVYETILSNAAPNGIQQGQGIDPLNPTNNPNLNWSASTTNSNILVLLSESATDLRYRDDLQVMTTNVYSGAVGGLSYVSGTCHAFGNNGTTAYNGSVNNGGNNALNNDLVTDGSVFISPAQLYADLATASDHLPVVADYTIPISAPAPVANFTAGPTNGIAPLTVYFSNLSSNATNYSWDFGDGNTSALADDSDTYTNPGIYSVTLTAIGAGGTNILTLTNYITVSSPPPLQLGNFVVLPDGEFQFTAGNSDGTFITSNQESQIEIFATTDLTQDFTNWTMLTNVAQLTNGVLQINDTNSVSYPQRFYRAVETP